MLMILVLWKLLGFWHGVIEEVDGEKVAEGQKGEEDGREPNNKCAWDIMAWRWRWGDPFNEDTPGHMFKKSEKKSRARWTVYTFRRLQWISSPVNEIRLQQMEKKGKRILLTAATTQLFTVTGLPALYRYPLVGFHNACLRAYSLNFLTSLLALVRKSMKSESIKPWKTSTMKFLPCIMRSNLSSPIDHSATMLKKMMKMARISTQFSCRLEVVDVKFLRTCLFLVLGLDQEVTL